MLRSFNTTGIGSIPYSDPFGACRVIFDFMDIPFWPQLPHRSFLEFMVPQYSEGFPFVKIAGEHIYVEKADEETMASFYEAVESKKGFGISREYAAGLYAFIDMLKERGQRIDAVKGQVTGPLTFTLSIADNQKRPIYFNEEMRELALELLKGKASWQIQALRPYADKVLIFIDEPVLSAIGTSSYIGVDNADVIRLLSGLVDHIKASGGIAGIHCCGRAYWPLVFSSRPDILSFDAYFFWDTLSLYPGEVSAFMNDGGFIAWGVVPTTDEVKGVVPGLLREQLERGLSSLERIDIPADKVRGQVLLTPSCGTGSLGINDATKVFSLLKGLRDSYAGR